MLWVYGHLIRYILILSEGGRLYTSESDVYRRQILTYKYGPRAARVNPGRVSLILDQHYPELALVYRL